MGYGSDLQLTQPILLLTPASLATFTDTFQGLQCIFALLKCTRSRNWFLCHLKYTSWLHARSRHNSKGHCTDLLGTYLPKMLRLKSFKSLGRDWLAVFLPLSSLHYERLSSQNLSHFWVQIYQLCTFLEWWCCFSVGSGVTNYLSYVIKGRSSQDILEIISHAVPSAEPKHIFQFCVPSLLLQKDFCLVHSTGINSSPITPGLSAENKHLALFSPRPALSHQWWRPKLWQLV